MNILYAEPDQNSIEMVRAFMEFADVRVTSSNYLGEAEEIARSDQFDIFLTEFNFPGQNSLLFCRTLKRLFPDTPIICYSEAATDSDFAEIADAGVENCIRKPAINDLYIAVTEKLGVGRVEVTSAGPIRTGQI
ncbi:MAG: response regulator [Pyrinomonadaceae bacterium]|nr:response regulator [Pyrinomonadaceae bacterium]